MPAAIKNTTTYSMSGSVLTVQELRNWLLTIPTTVTDSEVSISAYNDQRDGKGFNLTVKLEHGPTQPNKDGMTPRLSGRGVFRGDDPDLVTG